MTALSKSEALLRSIDNIIENYAGDNPELLSELIKLRAEAQEAHKKRRLEELALIGLRVATWVKFIIDHLPPYH